MHEDQNYGSLEGREDVRASICFKLPLMDSLSMVDMTKARGLTDWCNFLAFHKFLMVSLTKICVAL